MSSVLVGSAYGILELRAAQFDQGVDASLAKLAQLRQAFSQGIPPVTLPPVGGGLPGPLTPRQLPGGQAPDIQKDEQAMLRYASSLAQAQKAQGDLSGAASTYRTVLGQLTPNTIEANRATAALAATESALAKEAANGAQLAGPGGGLAGAIGGLTTAAAVAVPALLALKGAADLAETGAQAERTATAFDTLATKAGTTGAALLGALRNASGREVSDLNLQLAATKAEFTGVATSAADFSRLMAIARNNSREFGISTADGFNRLIDALDRGQVRGLKQIGLNIDLKKAEADYAQSIGVTVASLDAEQKRQALVQATLALGEQQLQKTGGAVTDTASGQERLGASFDNLKAKAGSFIADGVAPMVNSLSDLLDASDGSAEGVQTLAIGAINFSRTLAGMPALTDAEARAQRGWTQSVQDWIAAREVQIGLANAPTGSSSGGTFDLAVIQSSITAQRAYADSLELTGVRARAAAQAADQKSTSDKVAALDAQTHGIAEEHLAQQAENAALALLHAGPAGARTAAILAGSSGQVDVLTAAYYRLAAAQQAAKTNDPLKGVAEDRSTRDTAGDIAQGRAAGIQAAQARADAATQARVNQIDRTGTATQKVTERQKEYNAAVAQFGVHSAQAINAQTNLIEAQKAAEKTGGRGRVSAAQSTGLQLQNVEENTQAQLLKTQREGLERMRDAQQDFDLKRSRSKEDEDEKIRHLFETGQRAAAARERADFAKQQRRDQEDFNIQRQRTIRNNQEATGDISGAAERRTGQIDERAALRGVRPGGANLGNSATPAIGGGGLAAAARGPQPIAQLSIQGVLNIDGKVAGNAVWPTIQILVDDDLAASIRQIGAPNSTQAALAGTAP